MAHMVPPDYPPGTSSGERLVFDALRGPSVRPEWTVLHSLHLPDHVRQVEGEADFVVLMPGLGVLCLEVKGVRRAEFVDGVWYLGSDPSPDIRGPFRQADEAFRSVKKKVTGVFPGAERVLFWPGVLFTHCVPTSKVAGEWHPWQVLTSADLDAKPLADLLEDMMRQAREHVASVPNAPWLDLSPRRPSNADCDAIRRVLRPDVHFLPATSAFRKHRQEEIRRFTDEQLEAIEGLDGNDRAIIEGPAGTGKTVIAFEQARGALADGSRTALLCFNRLLADYLKQQASDLGLKGQISTIHSLMEEVAGKPEADPDDLGRFYSHLLPELALARLLDIGPLFDVLILDEAQDLVAPAYLDVLDGLLVGELKNGRWRAFADFAGQTITREVITKEWTDVRTVLKARAPDAVPYTLKRNCRNTPRCGRLDSEVRCARPRLPQRKEAGPWTGGRTQDQLLLLR